MQLALDFLNFIRGVYQNTYMIRNMVIRDIRARYIGSFLGIFWSIIHPLTQLLVYYFVFSVILKVKLGPEYETTNFAIWLVAGLLPWMFFAEVFTRSPGVILEQSSIITKPLFPSEILSLTLIVAAMINPLIPGRSVAAVPGDPLAGQRLLDGRPEGRLLATAIF